MNLVPAPGRDSPYQHAGILNFVFGHVWQRPGLGRRDRRFLTVACVGVDEAPLPILSHVGSALGSGDISKTEMDELILTFRGVRQRRSRRRAPGRGRDSLAARGRARSMSILAPSARLVGNRISRKEDPRLLTGRGRYVDDVVVPGMLHVAFARSDIARGRIVGVDVEAAREADGVVAVLTAVDLNHVLVGPMGATPVLSMGPPGPNKVLADDEVRYVGDPYALVVAKTRALAEDALELIELDVEPLPPVVDYTTALESSERVHPDTDSNVAGAMPMPPDDELRRDLRVGSARVDRALRAEPLSRGADGDSRDRGLVAAASRFVRCVRLHPVAARRAHRHEPHHRRAREPDPGADGRRRRRLRPEGLPRPRRTDRCARQLPPRQAAQVDRRSTREPARRDNVTRGMLHGHSGGRRGGQDPRDRSRPPRRGRRLPASRERGRPWARSSSPGRTASRSSRSSRSRRSRTRARARPIAGHGSSRPTSANRPSTASPGSWASIRSSCGAATCCSATSSPTRCPSASPCSTCRRPRRSSKPRRWSTTTRSACGNGSSSRPDASSGWASACTSSRRA